MCIGVNMIEYEQCDSNHEGVITYMCNKEKGHKGVHYCNWIVGDKQFSTWW